MLVLVLRNYTETRELFVDREKRRPQEALEAPKTKPHDVGSPKTF